MKLYRNHSHNHTWREIQVFNRQLAELADGLSLKWSHHQKVFCSWYLWRSFVITIKFKNFVTRDGLLKQMHIINRKCLIETVSAVSHLLEEDHLFPACFIRCLCGQNFKNTCASKQLRQSFRKSCYMFQMGNFCI